MELVEVIRCRDCQYWWEEKETCAHPKNCDGWTCVIVAEADHFCGYGKEKNDG